MHNEPWQVFAQNGEPLAGRQASRADFQKDPSLIMGASHVWFWRRRDNSAEVLLQKRASTLRSWPSYFDITAAGHIDANESAISAAVRECKEEVGVEILGDDLHYIFSLRTPINRREFDVVYIFEVKEDLDFHFDDGEVEEVLWISIDTLENWAADTNGAKLVPQGEEYFGLLIKNIKFIIDEDN